MSTTKIRFNKQLAIAADPASRMLGIVTRRGCIVTEEWLSCDEQRILSELIAITQGKPRPRAEAKP